MNRVDDNISFDVVIVGGGPAGTSCAIRLALAGLKVLLVEKATFPREKLCGEFISPECVRHFLEIGVMPDIAASAGTDIAETIFYSKGGKGVSFKSEWFGRDKQSALGLSRAALDNILMRRAMEAGVEVHEQTTVGSLKFNDDRLWEISLKRDGQRSKIRSPLMIDATGRARILTRQFEAAKKKRPAKFVAFKTHLAGADISENACEIYAYKGGYGGCSRVENGIFNICFIASADLVKERGGDADRLMREVVCGNQRAAGTLHGAEAVKSWLAVPIDQFGRAEIVPTRGLLTIGDSAAFIDPFTGSGILLALESAKIASAAIIAASANGSSFEYVAGIYRREYSAAFETRFRASSIFRNAAFFPWLAAPAISLLGLSSKFRRALAHSTRGRI